MSHTLELPDAVYDALQQAAASDGVTPADWIAERVNRTFDSWQTKLAQLRGLATGWNGYSAAPPNEKAIQTADRYLGALRSSSWEPDRLEPSAMGGVGITHRRNGKKVYIEFYNDGRVHALFSERGDPPRMSTQPVGADPLSFEQFIAKARSYLNA